MDEGEAEVHGEPGGPAGIRAVGVWSYILGMLTNLDSLPSIGFYKDATARYAGFGGCGVRCE